MVQCSLCDFLTKELKKTVGAKYQLISLFLHTQTGVSFPFLFMFLQYYRSRTVYQDFHFNSLIFPALSTHTQHLVIGGLWNCQSATQKTEFISHPPQLLSTAFSFSHTPRPRGGGTGLLNPCCCLPPTRSTRGIHRGIRCPHFEHPRHWPPLHLLGDFNIQTEKSSDLLLVDHLAYD